MVHGISVISLPENHQAIRRDFDYPLEVVLSVIIEFFPPQVIEDYLWWENQFYYNPSQTVPYPAWGGGYNNILAIISSNKTNIINSLWLIGTTFSETRISHIFELAADCKFEEPRDIIAKEFQLNIIIKSHGLIKSYDFFGSEGYFIDYLSTKNLCNDRYNTNFKCHQCSKSFETTSMISSLGSVTDDFK